ncbi:ATP-binding protein [Actinoplanes bogorensis]|uniref:ATP-binding protein n=1 Tax=Paractinoplanes bogorensis TaxID=1610840 RepID=A0ABS5YWY5_9ACTN|nr:ATP-binding protein [Actinoplanes bogorensis]MBU2667964.1 ATP-binding protein [Actinoplanes bogorensis]
MRAVLVRSLSVAVALALLMSVTVWRLADRDAGRFAEQLARRVATALLVPMAAQSFQQPGGFDRAVLLDRLQPFLAGGVVERVKVLAVRGDRATVVFSDEPRAEGLAEGLGRPSVAGVPRDASHRYERSLAGSAKEVFFPFRDAHGQASRLELYVPVDTARPTIVVVLAVLLAGLIVPLIHTRSRRPAFPAGELARRDLARHLHDGVIPELAGARMLVDNLRDAGDADLARAGVTRGELADRLHTVLSSEIGQLRTLLTELVPPEPVGVHLPSAVDGLVDRLRPASALVITTSVPVLPGLPAAVAPVLLSVAGELLRNAIRHASATAVHIAVTAAAGRIRLTVADDGIGFDPHAPVPAGHVGLRLVRDLLREHGGVLAVAPSSGAGATLTATWVMPRPTRCSILPGRLQLCGRNSWLKMRATRASSSACTCGSSSSARKRACCR